MTSQVFPARFESPAGLSVQVHANGSIRRIDHRGIILNLFLGSEIEGGPANIYLRRHGASIESVPLFGPRSPAAVFVDEDGLAVQGQWNDIGFTVSLTLAQSAPAWLWRGRLEHRGAGTAVVDLIYAQDLALAHYGAVRMNEYYVSQYVDYTPLVHARCGSVLAVRQNLSMGGRNPWAVIGSLRNGVSFATDALQFHGLATRAGEVAAGLCVPMLPGKRRQHEHSMAVIQDAQLRLDPGAPATLGFFGWFEEHHAEASSPADLAFVDRALALPEANSRLRKVETPSDKLRVSDGARSATLFSARPTLKSLDLTEAELAELFGTDWRNVEREKGCTLSFFTGANRHVVLKAKELTTLRPHGHLIRSGDHLVPDEASLTSTTWMAGVFNSLVTQGHVNINRFLSTPRSYLSLQRSAGQRIFVALQDGYHLLDVPSAYEMTPNGCRWVYKHEGGVIEVRSWAPIDRHELNLSIEVLAGAPCRFLVSHHIALNGDDGADALPPEFVQDEDGVAIRPAVECDVSRRFPDGFFRIDAGRGTIIEHVGGDEDLFLDGESRRLPFVTIRIAQAREASLRITGHLIQKAEAPFDKLRVSGENSLKSGRGSAHAEPVEARGGVFQRAASGGSGADIAAVCGSDQSKADQFWQGMVGPLTLHAPDSLFGFAARSDPTGSGPSAEGFGPQAGPAEPTPTAGRGDAGRLQEILPWLAHNAMIHYLAPRGLEQFSGGGWGTRDVCQGPVEMLLALGRWEPLRDLLLRVFKTQNSDGDWPQWFMFFERERRIRPGDSHGDIVFWPLLALAQYLIASEDASLLDATAPFFHPEGDERAEKATIWGHVERALTVIDRRVIPGTRLAAYGHGDWNDSLQPVDQAMCERLCSAWTVTLHYQMLATLAKALRRIGRPEPAETLEAAARSVKDDFQRLLIVDGTIPGYAYFQADGRIEYLLHSRDRTTGITYSLLPMIHAIINDLLTAEQAAAHVACIKEHLLAVDGARLFDRPFSYHGGPQHYFQRAESSTFFGREIGIMYTHAHLRYAEAMARYGDADALVLALRQANPIGLRSAVPAAMPRQANCYYSSSDAAFLDRYQALAEYEKVKTGEVPLEGGWRVYSSGAGIALRLIHECLLGIRRRKSVLVLDPVIPKALDGLRAEVELAGRRVTVVYRSAQMGYGPTAIALNGTPLPFEREANPYRTGGVAVAMAAVSERLTGAANTLQIQLG
jgi:cellobiose phosphorylase